MGEGRVRALASPQIDCYYGLKAAFTSILQLCAVVSVCLSLSRFFCLSVCLCIGLTANVTSCVCVFVSSRLLRLSPCRVLPKVFLLTCCVCGAEFLPI